MMQGRAHSQGLQAALEARKDEETHFTPEPLGGPALPTPWLYLMKLSGLLASRNRREYVCTALSHQVCGNLL